MTNLPLTYTVTMDARLAKEVGIAPALLYNLLAWQSQTPMVQDYDPDGWFYCTSAYFSEKTSLHPNTFTKAIKALVEAGLIECERRFVKYGYKDTNKSVNHFRVIQSIEDFVLTRDVSCPHTACENNNKEEKIKEESQFTQSDELSPQPSALGASPATPSRPAPIENEDLPFGADSKKVSVRPDKKEADSSRRPFAVATQVLKAWGYKSAKVSKPLADKVKNWLDSGFSLEQIIEAGNFMKTSGDGYWQSATPIQLLSENGMLWYQAHRKEVILRTTPHIEMGGVYYRIDPKTGGIVERIDL